MSIAIENHMINSEKIINAIHQKFESLDSNDTDDWTNSQWTKAVKTTLCRVGRDFGCSVWASGVEGYDKDGGEWLYDVTWLKYKGDLLKSLSMAAECEWGTRGAVKDDFEKLLLARAAVRVMVFDGMMHEGGAEATANEICNWIGAYEDSQKGDTYLLIGYEADEDNWWFRYFKILVDNLGEQPKLIKLPLS